MIRHARLGDEAGIANVHVKSWKSTYKGLVPDSFLDSLNAEKLSGKSSWNQILFSLQKKTVKLAALLLMVKKEPTSILPIPENCLQCIY